MTPLALYERACRSLAVHGPEYRLLVLRNDGPARGIPRILFHASWALYAAALTAAMAAVAPHAATAHPFWFVGAALTVLYSIKIGHVLDGTYRSDPLDWLCDVGAWGSAGGLLVALILLHAPIAPIAWLLLALLYLLTYPWATP